jgi:hypothetical protein
MSCSKLLRPKEGQTSEELSQEHAHFLCHQRDVHKEFVLAGQTVNSAYYCDVLRLLREKGEDFSPIFGNKRTGFCIMTTHRLTLPFSPGHFLPKTT